MLLGLAIWLSPAALSLWAQPPPAQVENHLKQAVEDQPNDFRANFSLGGFYLQQGKLEAGIPYLETAHRIDPSHYNCGFDLAVAYWKIGEFDLARTHLRKMVERKDAAELHNLLGAVEETAGDIMIAAKEYQRAAEMDPTEKHVLDYGNTLVKYRAYASGLKILRWAAGKYPRSAPIKVGFGVALYSHGHYDAAVEALCEAVDLDPQDPRPLYFLGKMYDVSPAMAGEVTKRLAGFAGRYPDNPAANYYYALSLWKSESDEGPLANTEEVESLLNKAVKRDPKHFEAHYQLGALYERQKRYDEAIREYRLTVKLRPDFDRAYYRLGQTYRRTGQNGKAHKVLETYQRIHKQKKIQSEQEEVLELNIR